MGKQKVDPGPRVVQPSKHEVQFEAPVELEKVPTGQSTQVSVDVAAIAAE